MKKNALLLFALLTAFHFSFAQTNDSISETIAIKIGSIASLADIYKKMPTADSIYTPEGVAEIENFKNLTLIPEKFKNTALPKNFDALYQKQRSQQLLRDAKDTIKILVNTEAVNSTQSGVNPPDPAGDVNDQYYVSMSNGVKSLLTVYDKKGNVVLGAVTTQQFWFNLNGSPVGDPIVLFDPLSKRWFISEITFNSFYVAVSQTDNPLGGWTAYEFITPGLPDYPKFGVWNDAIYLCTNETGRGIPTYFLNKSDLINGVDNVRIQRLTIPKFAGNSFWQVATPADLDGTIPPPPNSPMYILRMYDDSWLGGQDKLEVWAATIDWANAKNSKISQQESLSTSPFKSALCTSFGQCLTMPNGTKLDVLQDALMYRIAYRNFGDHESMVLNHVVDVDNTNHAAIRWYELRKTPITDWSIYQQGTFSFPDNNNRFMASIAMNGLGDIAMGYTVMGPQVSPSLRVTGRRNGDPLGLMTFDEKEIAKGGSYPTINRWGDYFNITPDTRDDRSFWLTGQYRKTSGWGTRVVEMNFSRDSSDVAINSIISPASAPTLGNQEKVKISVKNVGFKSASNFILKYGINDGNFNTDTISAPTINKDSVLSYTFKNTADFSSFGTYKITAIVKTDGDIFALNDTIVAFITKLPYRDIAIDSVNNLNNTICSTSAIGNLKIVNRGFDTLKTFSVQYILDNNAPKTITSTISNAGISTDKFIYVPFSIDSLPYGQHQIKFFTQNPNNSNDQISSNDTLNFSLNVLKTGSNALMQLTTDDYPKETSWDIRDANNNLVLKSPVYVGKHQTYLQSLCLDSTQCYTFNLYDAGSDGINAFNNKGDLVIKNLNGQIFLTLPRPDFGSKIAIPFCAATVCKMSVQTESNGVCAGSNNGIVKLNPIQGIPIYRFSIDSGKTFVRDSVFTGLAAGNYNYVVVDTNNCTQRGNVAIANIPNPFSVTVDILTDTDPTETSWQLTDADGKIIVKSGGYTTAGNHYKTSLCLDTSKCYTFTIFDSFGNGLNGSVLKGNYNITTGDGKLLAYGKKTNFGFKESRTFCAKFPCNVTADVSSLPTCSAGRADGVIICRAKGGTPGYAYSLDGVTFTPNSQFTQLKSGKYTVTVRDTNDCRVVQPITISNDSTKELITIDIYTDSNPQETFWSLLDTARNIVASGDGYTDRNKHFISNWCLDTAQCYTFIIYDRYGDGMNGGNYTIKNGRDSVLAQLINPLFGRREDNVFCPKKTISKPNAVNDVSKNILRFVATPNPFDKYCEVELFGIEQKERVTLNIFDVQGKLITTATLARYNDTMRGIIILDEAPAGIYFIKIKDLPNEKAFKLVKE